MTTTPAPSISVFPLTAEAVGPFATGWKYGQPEDVHAWLELAGVRQPYLTAGADFTLTGANPTVDGGTVTLSLELVPAEGWSEGDRLVLARRTVKRQALALPDAEGHKPRSTEQALDKLMRTAEEQSDHLDHAVRVPSGEPGIQLMPDALRDGRLPVFADGGIGFLDTPERLVATDAEGKAYTLPLVQALNEIGLAFEDFGPLESGAPLTDDYGALV